MAEQNRKRTFLQPPAFGISWQMSDSAPAPDYSLAFDPAPSASRRHDGWTPERQRRFIAALQEIGMVSAAAASVGMSRKSAYSLLKRAGPDSSFALRLGRSPGRRADERLAHRGRPCHQRRGGPLFLPWHPARHPPHL
jgi:hypothetical protein